MAISKETVKSLATSLDALIQQASLSDNTNLSERARLQFDQLKAALPHDAGGAATSDWAALSEADQKARLDELTARINDLTIELSPPGLTGSRMLMSGNPAPSWVILFLLVLAMAGIFFVLLAISQHWDAAMSATNAQAAPQSTTAQAKGKASEPAKSPDAQPKGKAGEPAKSSDAPPKSKASEPGKSSEPAAKSTDDNAKKSSDQPADTAPAKDAQAKSDEAPTQVEPDRAGEKQQAPAAANQPTSKQTEVLLMVILLGTLGGLIHLASSLTIYVGNRDLKRSWIIYYVLAPFQGAALAPLLYLLLKSAVLTPSSANSSSTENLNLTAIYAFAGLTGLFAKQAIEKLADVFATLFSSIKGKDKTKDGATGSK